MPLEIHPTALVDAKAVLGDGTRVGPYVVVESGARIGRDCVLMSFSHVMTNCEMGDENVLHPGAVLGGAPQDKNFNRTTPSFLRIGNANVFREHVTVHRASTLNGQTSIGNRNYFMANSHVAHDVDVADDIVLCNNSLLAGYVTVGRGAFISGNVAAQQFTRIGDLCMLAGGCAVAQDAPPFTTIVGRSQIRGLNVVGMRRSGIPKEERLKIKVIYKEIFARRGDFDEVRRYLETIESSEQSDVIRDFYMAKSNKGLMWPPQSRDDRADDRFFFQENP